jgi:hypothetical protein
LKLLWKHSPIALTIVTYHVWLNKVICSFSMILWVVYSARVSVFRKFFCHDLSLGLMTKAWAWKDEGQECNPRFTFTLLECKKVWGNEPTPPSGFPFWVLEPLWRSKFLENNFRGQNSLDWRFPYTNGKLLRHRCPKWACMIYLNTYNTSYGWKKSWESNYKFDSWPLKIKNHPDLCVCKWHATYH